MWSIMWGYTCMCALLAWIFQRSHGLFGNRVDSFSAEPANAQHPQMTNQRPLQFSESQPESPPNSSALVANTEFFPTAAPKSNTNNNAFAEWAQHTHPYYFDDICSERLHVWWVACLLFFRFSFEREGSPEEFYNPYEDEESGMVQEKEGHKTLTRMTHSHLKIFIQITSWMNLSCLTLKT